MTGPQLTVVVPTQGRPTLPRALASIYAQAQPADVEIIVVADTHGPLLDDVEGTARFFRAVYLEHDAGFHGYGHPQIMTGYWAASGRWLLALGDDDEYTPGALPLIADATRAADPGVILWRIVMHPSVSRRVPHPFTIWSTRMIYVGNVSGQSICLPNDPNRLPASYPPHSTGDFDFIAAAVEFYGGVDQITWREEVICACR